MKFHCDRCRTRYQIADERVRGKILKIRCKNCSAVITVREGMDSTPVGLSAAHSAPPGDRMATEVTPGTADRQDRVSSREIAQRRAAPLSPVASGSLRSSASLPRRAAPSSPVASGSLRSASHPRRNAPPVKDWYVSLEGESKGPFSIAEARAWVSGQASDEELYCWRAGFDDWLPVEDVAQFQGLDRRLPSVTVATPTPEAILPEERASSPHISGLPHRPESAKPTFQAPALAARQSGPVARAGVPSSAPAATSDRHSTEQASRFTPGRGAAAMAATVPAPGNGVPATPNPQGAARPSNGVEHPASLGSVGAAPGADNASHLSDDAFNTGGDDLDFEIAEPSRIVKLPMLAAYPGGAGAAHTGERAQGPGGMPGMARSSDGLNLGRGTGSTPAVSGAATGRGRLDGGFEPVGLESDKTRRRSMMLFFIAVAGVSAAVLAFFLLSSQQESTDARLRSNIASDFEDLGLRHESPQGRVVTDDKGPRVIKRKKSKDGRRTSRSSSGGTTRAKSEQKVATTPRTPIRETGPLTKLTADDVQRMATRNQPGLVRCYERAKRKDPFLEVKSLRATLSVSAQGTVSSVKLQGNTGQMLGQCLQGSIGRWRFRPSTNGITADIGLKFGQ